MPILPELLELLEGMSEREQTTALELLRTKAHPQGIRGEVLIAWARQNPIDVDDLAGMERVIEEGCEVIDYDQWGITSFPD